MIRRVCLVGAESTWKTTLAIALAVHFETVWVPEYGREFSEKMMQELGHYDFTSADFVHIAEQQIALEDAAELRANRVLILDTDAFATAIWHRRYMGSRSPETEAIVARARRPDLYLLTDVDTPFVADGYRDGEAIRDWMHATFIEELKADSRPFVELRGTFEERFATAVSEIEKVLGDRS